MQASKPDPAHRIKLCTGGWQCERCGFKGYKLFRGPCKKEPRFRQRVKKPDMRSAQAHIHEKPIVKNRELAEEDKSKGQTAQENGPPHMPNKRKAHGSEASKDNEGSDQPRVIGGIKRNIEYAEKDQPRVKRYRIYKKGPDKIRPIRENEAYDAYDICEKDLQKHTGRPPGCERRGGASASGRASDI